MGWSPATLPTTVAAVSAAKLSGVLVLDKPKGPTSHDIVSHVRRALKTREVGHAGTLDPMATGVLVVAIGEATKLVPWLTAHDKSYQATVALGVQTDTLDADGREDARVPPSSALREALEGLLPHTGGMIGDALAQERARTSQVPPGYSAIRTEGERAFQRARRGVREALPPRAVAVHRLDVTACSADPPWLAVEVDVAKGYYVRALARDLASALGTVGHLSRLRRVRSGPFLVEEAVALHASADVLRARVAPLAVSAARALPVARLTETGVRDARCGRVVKPSDIQANEMGPSAWLDAQGVLVAIGQADPEGGGRVVRGFAETTE